MEIRHSTENSIDDNFNGVIFNSTLRCKEDVTDYVLGKNSIDYIYCKNVKAELNKHVLLNFKMFSYETTNNLLGGIRSKKFLP